MYVCVGWNVKLDTCRFSNANFKFQVLTNFTIFSSENFRITAVLPVYEKRVVPRAVDRKSIELNVDFLANERGYGLRSYTTIMACTIDPLCLGPIN